MSKTMTKNDVVMLKLLALGKTQVETSKALDLLGHSASSLSHIEKRLRAIRKQFKANNNFHLAVKLAKEGII